MSTMSTIDTLRSFRLYDMAVFDWAASLFGAYLIGKYILRIYLPSVWLLWFVVWTLLGVAVHAALGINTMFGYYIGLNPKPERKSGKNETQDT